MQLQRNRITTLIKLADLERRVTGPERLLHEPEVALLVKAAYDDAVEPARTAFMARVQALPTTAWPWSAVQVRVVRPVGGSAASGGRAIGSLAPTPNAVVPPVLTLIRGEAESAEADPGDRLPDRGTPDGAPWEPLHRALDAWDTQAIARWIGPQGWVIPGGAAAGQAASSDGANQQPASDSPATPPAQSPRTAFSWRSPTVIAVGTTVASTLGVVLFSLRRRREPATVVAQENP